MREPDQPDAIGEANEIPSDLRDTVEAAPESLRRSVEAHDDLAELDGSWPSTDTYSAEVPTGARRPHAAVPADSPQVTRDPTLSRAVDAEAAGVDPATMGFGEREERDGEAGHPGPLAPDVEDPAPDQ